MNSPFKFSTKWGAIGYQLPTYLSCGKALCFNLTHLPFHSLPLRLVNQHWTSHPTTYITALHMITVKLINELAHELKSRRVLSLSWLPVSELKVVIPTTKSTYWAFHYRNDTGGLKHTLLAIISQLDAAFGVTGSLVEKAYDDEGDRWEWAARAGTTLISQTKTWEWITCRQTSF